MSGLFGWASCSFPEDVDPTIYDGAEYTRATYDSFMLPEHTNRSGLPSEFQTGPMTLELLAKWQASVGGVWTGAGDLGYAAFSTVALIFIRYGVERYIAKPIAIWGGISPNTRTAPLKNKVLEAAYKKSRKVPKNEMELEALVAKSGLESAREVERWYRRTKNHHAPTKMVKFQEGFWRGMFYTVACFVGYYTLYDEPYLWDNTEVYNNYPFHKMTDKVQWYYFIKLAFYASLSITGVLFDVARKDFWEMQLHHWTTMLLMVGSYSCGLHRIGALILLVHDVSDVFLEWAKGTNYIWEGSAMTQIFFALFAVMFLVCRLILYPVWMIWPTINHAKQDFCTRNVWINNYHGVLLCILACLHCFWMYLITNILIKAVTGNKLEDSREAADSEENGAVDDDDDDSKDK